MPKFNVNYSKLFNDLSKKSYKLSDVADKIEKVAFDVVRFRDDDVAANLWEIQSADDGDYIVAKYDSVEDNKKVASNWDVMLNKSGSALVIFYKDYEITKVAKEKLDKNTDLNLAVKVLKDKLGSSKELVNSLFKEIDSDTKKVIYTKFPELA